MWRAFRELVLSLLLAGAMFLSIDAVSARSYIDGPSMEPNLYRGQHLLFSRLGLSGLTRQAYAATHPSEGSGSGVVPPRGSICTFAHPQDPSRLLVKRVIALPGEEISLRNGVTYIDGKPLSEPYVVNPDNRSLPAQRIPAGFVFVMGDNRPASGDSRLFGPVPQSNLLGVALLRYWPPSQIRLLAFDSWD